jgi:hypothetical protein
MRGSAEDVADMIAYLRDTLDDPEIGEVEEYPSPEDAYRNCGDAAMVAV